MLSPVRTVCANTQSAAIARARSTFGISHTSSARLAIQEAREALKLSWRYIEAFEAEAAELYAAPMDVEQVGRFARQLFKVEQGGSEAAQRGRAEQANAIVKLFVSSPLPTAIAQVSLLSCVDTSLTCVRRGSVSALRHPEQRQPLEVVLGAMRFDNCDATTPWPCQDVGHGGRVGAR